MGKNGNLEKGGKTMKETTWPILYKHSSTGKIQQWRVYVKGKNLYTESGDKGGKLTTSKPTICEPKNVGRSNERSAEEQAITEAQSRFQKKVDEGYAENIEDSGAKHFEPMLAESYRDKETGDPEKWVQKEVWDKECKKFVQPKLDGLRAINKKKTLTSREGKHFVTCQHLLQDVMTLDGELYNHKFKHDFNAIVSMIKQQKPTEVDIAHAKKYAQMWVYDAPEIKGNFETRYKALEKFFNECKEPFMEGFVLVPTYEVKNEEELKEYHEKFKKLGYEGTILRVSEKKYENKRTRQLLKYKDFIDEEFLIVGYIEGKGGRKGTIGKFILQHDKNPDQTFKCNVKGKFDYLREVWKNRDYYIGKQATVQYFNRTPVKADGKGGDVPRFGYAIKLDRKSYE